MLHLFLDLDNTIFAPRQIPFKAIQDFYEFIIRMIPDDISNENFYEDFISLSFPKLLEKYHITVDGFKASHRRNNYFTEELNLKTYEDYVILKELPYPQYLVSSGFTDFQYQKIRNLGIENDFEKIIIDDPIYHPIGKTLAFSTLIEKYDIDPVKVVVIGDNTESEIKSAKELNLKTVLINRKTKDYPNSVADRIFDDFHPLPDYLMSIS